MNIRLSQIELPDGVTEIQEMAFAGARLTSFFGREDWKTIVLYLCLEVAALAIILAMKKRVKIK